MATTIQLKRSSTASSEPVANDLAVGELAVNTADGKLFTKHTDNSIVVISGGGGGGVTTGIKTNYTYTATASQINFSGADDNSDTLSFDDSDLLNLFLNGVRLVQGTDYTANSSTNTVTLTTGATLNDIIDIDVFGDYNAQGGASVNITGGTISGLSSLSVNGNVTVKGNVLPDSDTDYDLGSTTKRWKDLYLSGNSIFLGEATIQATGSAVTLPVGSGVSGATGNVITDSDVASSYLALSGGTLTGALTVGGYTLPTTDGTDGQVLTTNGSGTVSFEDAAGGGGGVSTGKAIAMAIVFGG